MRVVQPCARGFHMRVSARAKSSFQYGRERKHHLRDSEKQHRRTPEHAREGSR